jgi:hypothetical protein
MHLWACGTRQSQRQMTERFGRSLDTVSRKLGEALGAVVSFAHTIGLGIQPLDFCILNCNHSHPFLMDALEL